MLIRTVHAKRQRVPHFIPVQKKFTTRRAVVLHATWLVQALAHWPIFLTAASRRSLDRVSVPMWGTFLSEPLLIVGMVGRYPAIYLIRRILIRHRWNLWLDRHAEIQQYRVLIFLSKGYPRVPGRLDTCYAPVRRSPSTIASYRHAAPRLACVKPVASVHPEPGSNSSL